MVAARRFSSRVALGAVAALVAAACKPDLNETVSIVHGPQVLAVRSDPAEGAPGSNVAYTALYVDHAGPIASAPIDWAFCNARKPLAELGPVNSKCLQVAGDWFVRLGSGTRAMGTLPGIACRQFGPDVPEPVANQPPGRPVDPDPTGGYYQPVRLAAVEGGNSEIEIAETRLSCGLAGAGSDVTADFVHRYHPNANPAVDSLSLVVGGGPAVPLMTEEHGSNAVHIGAALSLRVAWSSACPSEKDVCRDGVCGPDETSASCPADCAMPAGCAGAERYVAFDLAKQGLVVDREAIAVSWFATDGSFDSDRTGRVSTDLSTTSDNGWRAPVQPGPVHLWVILRDDRGGVGWAAYVLDVR